jgi:hypothetical protein
MLHRFEDVSVFVERQHAAIRLEDDIGKTIPPHPALGESIGLHQGCVAFL